MYEYLKYDIFCTKRGSSTRHIWWSSLGGRLSKKRKKLSGPLQRGARNDSEIGCQIFWVVLVSYLLITSILIKIGTWDLFHIIGILILYKTKKKVFFNAFFFFEIYPIFYEENGKCSNLWLKNSHNYLPNYPRNSILCSLERGEKDLYDELYFTFM